MLTSSPVTDARDAFKDGIGGFVRTPAGLEHKNSDFWSESQLKCDACLTRSIQMESLSANVQTLKFVGFHCGKGQNGKTITKKGPHIKDLHFLMSPVERKCSAAQF